MIEAAMIFAAGFGTRMGALTRERPKPLLTVGGQTLIDRVLALAGEAGVARRVVNTHYLADMIAAHLEGRGVAVSNEAPELLDTGGGLRAALSLLDANPVFTGNSDAIFDGPNPFTFLRDAWLQHWEALLLVVPLSNAVGRQGKGDFDLRPDGRLVRGTTHVYCGVQILRTERVSLELDTVFSLNRIWDAIAADGELRGAVYPGRWCDVGHPGGVTLAEAMLDARDV